MKIQKISAELGTTLSTNQSGRRALVPSVDLAIYGQEAREKVVLGMSINEIDVLVEALAIAKARLLAQVAPMLRPLDEAEIDSVEIAETFAADYDVAKNDPAPPAGLAQADVLFADLSRDGWDADELIDVMKARLAAPGAMDDRLATTAALADQSIEVEVLTDDQWFLVKTPEGRKLWIEKLDSKEIHFSRFRRKMTE